MKNRSRIENKELEYNVRVGGRIFASFRRPSWAEDTAYAASNAYPDRAVELEGPLGVTLKLLPREIA